MTKRAVAREGTAGRSRIGGITVVGSTALLVLCRKLGEPWQSVLQLASPALSYIGAVLHAGISGWLARWQLARGLTRLKETADGLPAGSARSRIERRIQEIQDATTERQVRALKRIASRS